MRYVAGDEFLAEHGPCEVLDANGEVVPGPILEVDTETGEYVILVSPGSPHATESRQALAPLTLRKIK